MTDQQENPAQTIERITTEGAQAPQLVELVDGTQVLITPCTMDTQTAKETNRPLHHVKGEAVFQTLQSFGEYVTEYQQTGTQILVDLDGMSIRAVLNGHSPGVAGWCDHTAKFVPLASAEWADFSNRINVWGSREQFAELVNRRLGSFTDPSAADLMQLAQHFNVTTNVEFTSGEQLASGARTLNYVEEAKASAGGAGQITVPGTVSIRVRPYYDSDEYELDLGFRYKLREKRLELILEYPNLVDLKRVIFEDYVKLLDKQLGKDAPPFRFGPR